MDIQFNISQSLAVAAWPIAQTNPTTQVAVIQKDSAVFSRIQRHRTLD